MPRAGHHRLRCMQRISGGASVHGAAKQPQPQDSPSSRSNSICRPGSAESHHLSPTSSGFGAAYMHRHRIGLAAKSRSCSRNAALPMYLTFTQAAVVCCSAMLRRQDGGHCNLTV